MRSRLDLGLSPSRRRAVGHGLIVAGWLFGAYLFLVLAPATGTFGYDAFAYWNVDLPDPYAIPWGHVGAFSYAPPMALAFDRFDGIDWWGFLFLWTMLLVATVIWLGGRPLPIMAAFAVPFVAIELYHGNIHILLAAAVVLGFRHPWTWSFVLLTKPSSGVGLLWFVVRREWRSLAIALGATGALCLWSWMVLPSLWSEWIALLSGYAGATPERSVIPIPLWARLLAAAPLVVWGARTDRRWTVVVAACLTLPALWIAGLAMLIGVIPELRGRTVPARTEGPAVHPVDPRTRRLATAGAAVGVVAVGAMVTMVSLGQGRPSGLAALGSASVDAATLPVTVPYREVAGHIVIDVAIGDLDGPLTMILDSGAPTMVSRALVDTLHAEAAGTVTTTSLGTEATAGDVVHLPDLRIGSAGFGDVAALAGLIEPGNPVTCLAEAGVIGANLMRTAIWQIDPGGHEITIAGSVEELDHVQGAIRLPFEAASTASPSPLVRIGSGDGVLTFLVDTGSDGWLAVHPDDLAAVGIKVPTDAPAISRLATGARGPFPARLAYVAADLELGGLAIPAVPVAATDALPRGQGDLGNELLSRFVLTIDWSEGDLYLDPIAADLQPPAPLSATVTWADGYVLGSFVEGLAGAAGLSVGAPVEALDEEDTTAASFGDFCAHAGSGSTASSLTLSGDPSRRLVVSPVTDFFAPLEP